MPMCNRFIFAGCTVLFAAVEATPDDTQLAAKQLAAIQNLRSSVAKHSYALPDDKIRELVLASLRRDEAKPPKQMPPAKALQDDLDVDFESTWNEMIRNPNTIKFKRFDFPLHYF